MGRIVRVRLTLINNDTEIRTELEDATINTKFNQLDAEEFLPILKPVKDESAKNKKDRKEKNKTIPEGQRVQTDDYTHEPPYAHAGIHLVIDDGDQIEWFSARELNFIIDVGPDPELYLLPEALAANQPLDKARLHDHSVNFHNPFQRNDYPVICVNGSPERSGAMKNDPAVRLQRFYKFSVTLLGTDITLDPHIDGH